MNAHKNPFQQLYVADPSVSDTASVKLFSPEVLQSAIDPVFQGGNVVLIGSQGCGKTMILNLLRPELRIAYHREGVTFPVNNDMCRFVSAGLNVSSTQLIQVADKSMGNEDRDLRELPVLFADFFNYCVIADLLTSINLMGKHSSAFEGLVNTEHLDSFATALAQEACWHGAISRASSFNELETCVKERIYTYRQWINGNLKLCDFEENIGSTKSSIGIPISVAAALLRRTQVIDNDVLVLVRIDQLEAITRVGTNDKDALFVLFRKMLNRLLADRDTHVFYRIGSRPYGFNDPQYMQIWGTDARLEARRDYLPINMDDELFRRAEDDSSLGVFNPFVKDAFRKRIALAFDLSEPDLPEDLFSSVFGQSENEKRLSVLKQPISEDSRGRILGLDRAVEKGKWSKEWRDLLHGLLNSGGDNAILDAVLAAAWGRQTGGGGKTRQNRETIPPSTPYPWIERTWWRKERVGQAVLQAVTRGRQRFAWWGEQDIRDLADGNITIFLHICHRVWDAFLKQQAVCPPESRINILEGGSIPFTVQRSAIYRASDEWYHKLSEETMGESRQRFVQHVGELLNRRMLDDLAMSYPGANGFSIALAEYNADTQQANEVRSFLEHAVGYSVLKKREHSSKSKSTGRRIKFYFVKILYPRFQLPDRRTKEPLYVSLEKVREWLGEAKVLSPISSKPSVRIDRKQQTFDFGREPGDEL